MESYQDYLKDVSLGEFTKTELFWAIYSKVITAEENVRRIDGTTEQDWGLYRIGEYYYSTKDENEIRRTKYVHVHFGLQHSNDASIASRTAGGSDGPSHSHYYILGQLRRRYH